MAQINSDNLDWLGLSVEAAFDPCHNLAAAGAVLRAGYRPAEGVDPQTTLRVALSRYNTGHPERGFRNGLLSPVLPDWSSAESTVHAVFTSRHGMLPAVRALIDHLAENLPRSMSRCQEIVPRAASDSNWSI